MAEYILYSYFRSSTSYRVRIGMNLKNLPYELRGVHLLKNGGEQHHPDYKRLNPQGEVPTLVHQGRAIGQSFAILEYLDDLHLQPLLFPQDPYERARVRQFCENINSFLHPLANLKVLQKLEKDHGFSQDQKTAWIHHWYSKGLEVLETIVQKNKGQFCFGDSITAADVFLIPCLFTARRFGMDLSVYPKCVAIEKICLEIEAFKKAHPYRQPDTPEEERIS